MSSAWAYTTSNPNTVIEASTLRDKLSSLSITSFEYLDTDPEIETDNLQADH